MGQQQLLLLVLATVIVGIATVVGIQAFSQNNVKSNADAMLNDAVRIASDVQAWSQKSQPFGGPSDFGGAGFADVDMGVLGYEDPYANLNGSFEIESAAANDVVIAGTNDEFGNAVAVRVCGVDDEDVIGDITLLGDPDGAAADAPACP